MATATRLVLLVAALVAATARGLPPSLRMAAAAPVAIHALRPLAGSGGDLGRLGGVPCDSWRLAVEAYNMRDWKTVPADCEGYVGHDIYAGRALPRQDSLVVVDEAIAYAEGPELGGGGREVWVFDIDETSLSNLPYYAKHGFGTKPYNATSFNEYVLGGSAPALPETQRLFRKLIALGIKPVFLTGRTEDQRAVTVANLRRQGYSGWERLLLKPLGSKATAVAYKSGERRKLQDAGYVIVGNIGDQWSDILGAPDPLYYIA